MAPGRPHLCGPAVKAAHEDSRGAQQEELQDREAEQGQRQPLDVELEGEGERESGQGLAGYLYPLGGLSRGQTQPAGGSGGLSCRCAHGGGGQLPYTTLFGTPGSTVTIGLLLEGWRISKQLWWNCRWP